MKKSKNTSKDKFVKLSEGMINSPAYRALSAKAMALYPFIAIRYNGYNNGDISFSVREAAGLLKVGKSTAQRLFDELIDKGFIKITKDSSFSYKMKRARRFEITQWPLSSGVAPTNGWRFWPPKNF